MKIISEGKSVNVRHLGDNFARFGLGCFKFSGLDLFPGMILRLGPNVVGAILTI